MEPVGIVPFVHSCTREALGPLLKDGISASNVCKKGSEVNLLQPWAAKAYRADKWRRRPVHQDFATKACPGIERRRCYIRSISPITQIDSCSVA